MTASSEYLTRLIDTYVAVECREKAYFNLLILTQLHPHGAVKLDLSAYDHADSPFCIYLQSFKESGFRAKAYHYDGAFYPAYSDLIRSSKHPENDYWMSPLREGFTGSTDSEFMAVSVEHDIPDEKFKLTEATHLAVRLGLLKVLVALLPEDVAEKKTLLERRDSTSIGTVTRQFTPAILGMTAVHHAVLSLSVDMLQFMVENTIDVTSEDNRGNTCLHALLFSRRDTEAQLDMLDAIECALDVIWNGDPEIISKQEAFFKKKNADGMNVLQLAEHTKNKVLAEMMLGLPGMKHTDINAHAMGIDLGNSMLARAARLRKRATENSRNVIVMHGVMRALEYVQERQAILLLETQTRLSQSECALLMVGRFVQSLTLGLEQTGVIEPGMATTFLEVLAALPPERREDEIIEDGEHNARLI